MFMIIKPARVSIHIRIQVYQFSTLLIQVLIGYLFSRVSFVIGVSNFRFYVNISL